MGCRTCDECKEDGKSSILRFRMEWLIYGPDGPVGKPKDTSEKWDRRGRVLLPAMMDPPTVWAVGQTSS